jgi:hypothetical protein
MKVPSTPKIDKAIFQTIFVDHWDSFKKGTYKIIRVKNIERYIELSSRDPFLCCYCGNEMILWAIWHPKYGMLYDEYENIKAGKYTSPVIDGGEPRDRGSGCSVWPSPGGIQLSLFSL